MAKNDVVLLDGIIEQRAKDKLPSNDKGEVFEFFAFEQLLKRHDLTKEEIESGWVDGNNDGGIDGFFILINGHLLQDVSNFPWPKRNAEIEIYIITCKHHSTFQQEPLNSLLASIPEIFDLSIESSKITETYSRELLNVRERMHNAYKLLSIARATLSFQFIYASRGETSQVADNIRARAEQIIGTTEGMFSSSSARFHFIGASELIILYRQIKSFGLDLPFFEHLTREQNSYAILTSLDAYKDFVTDEQGALRRYLFDSNVRDYLGDTRVNEDIISTLQDINSPDFWWLNNGVTILATDAKILGKTIRMQDIQIVNGLQTTESIFRYFSSANAISGTRALLVKIIVSTDTSIRDRIIKATNNQSVVELSSLRATDKIQRDIEEILERNEWYYERRKNYYRNIGKPASRFVTPMYLAAGYVSLMLKNPGQAAQLKARFMRNEESYSIVFSGNTPLGVWPVITDILKRVENGLESIRPSLKGQGERFLAKWRNLIAFIIVGRLTNKFSYGAKELMDFDTSTINQSIISETWNFITQFIGSDDKKFMHHNIMFANNCCIAAAKQFKIEGVENVGKIVLISTPTVRLEKASFKRIRFTKKLNINLSDDFLNQVNLLLPMQPWKPKVHLEVAAKLECKAYLVSEAIRNLVAQEKRFRQVDGVVYDKDNNVIAIDTERVHKES